MELLRLMTKEDILELLSDGFCNRCLNLVHSRIRTLQKRKVIETSNSDEGLESSIDAEDMLVNGNAYSIAESSNKRPRKQWKSFQTHDSTFSNKDKKQSDFELSIDDGIGGDSCSENGLSGKEKEDIRLSQVRSKKDFSLVERINGRDINVLQGLELHTQVFNSKEQKKIVECIYRMQYRGQGGKLRERTYSEPRKWMRGKGRVTIQFGCCYNYAKDKNGNPPGIVTDEEVDPLPPLFKQMIKRMVRWNIVPSTCIPDSCIVNIYDEGDCIPPHIDHHDFVRPFYTVSFLNECNILFGSSLQVISPGEFSGPASICLPVGSVFVLTGNGADIAKHCIPSVSSKRISITFRKMDVQKLPYKFSPDSELVGVKPLIISSPKEHDKDWNLEIQQQKAHSDESKSGIVYKTRKELKVNKFGLRQ